jgi:hypothetical protein
MTRETHERMATDSRPFTLFGASHTLASVAQVENEATSAAPAQVRASACTPTCAWQPCRNDPGKENVTQPASKMKDGLCSTDRELMPAAHTRRATERVLGAQPQSCSELIVPAAAHQTSERGGWKLQSFQHPLMPPRTATVSAVLEQGALEHRVWMATARRRWL